MTSLSGDYDKDVTVSSRDYAQIGEGLYTKFYGIVIGIEGLNFIECYL